MKHKNIIISLLIIITVGFIAWLLGSMVGVVEEVNYVSIIGNMKNSPSIRYEADIYYSSTNNAPERNLNCIKSTVNFSISHFNQNDILTPLSVETKEKLISELQDSCDLNVIYYKILFAIPYDKLMPSGKYLSAGI